MSLLFYKYLNEDAEVSAEDGKRKPLRPEEYLGDFPPEIQSFLKKERQLASEEEVDEDEEEEERETRRARARKGGDRRNRRGREKETIGEIWTSMKEEEATTEKEEEELWKW